VEAIGSRAQFAWGLRTTQQEDANESGFGAGEVVGFAKPVLVFGDSAIGCAGAASEADVFKTAQGEVNFLLVEVHDGFTI
jgi:hypothetical protein